MPLFLASNFGDLGVAQTIGSGLVAASAVSLASLVCALPKGLRAKGRWHGWLAMFCAGAFFLFASFLMSTLQRELTWDDAWLFGLYLLPSVVAALSLWLTRKRA